MRRVPGHTVSLTPRGMCGSRDGWGPGIIFRDGTPERETAASDALVPPMTSRRSGELAFDRRREERGVGSGRHGAALV